MGQTASFSWPGIPSGSPSPSKAFVASHAVGCSLQWHRGRRLRKPTQYRSPNLCLPKSADQQTLTLRLTICSDNQLCSTLRYSLCSEVTAINGSVPSSGKRRTLTRFHRNHLECDKGSPLSYWPPLLHITDWLPANLLFYLTILLMGVLTLLTSCCYNMAR